MINKWTPEELKERLEKKHDVFLKLSKKGCGVCKLSAPAVERLEASGEFKLHFGEIQTDEYPEMLEMTESEVLPVFFVFKDQKMVGRFEGFKGLEKLKSFIQESLGV